MRTLRYEEWTTLRANIQALAETAALAVGTRVDYRVPQAVKAGVIIASRIAPDGVKYDILSDCYVDDGVKACCVTPWEK